MKQELTALARECGARAPEGLFGGTVEFSIPQLGAFVRAINASHDALLNAKCAEIERLKAELIALRQPLTAQQIKAGWETTFSTTNPYCPCNLKTFTKAVEWTERAQAGRPS